MNNNLNSFARQLNQKLKSFAANSYMQLVELNDAVNKVAKTVDGDPYEYIQIDDTISTMKSTSNKFLNQVYNVGATAEQVSKFSNKMRGMENKVGQLLAKDHPSNIFYFQFNNISHALDKLIPSNIASQKPKEHIEEQENNNPEKIGPNTFSGRLSDVMNSGTKPLSSKDLLDKDNQFYKENPYAGNSSNPAEFNEEMENRKGASRKSKLTKKANDKNQKILDAIKSVLKKLNNDLNDGDIMDTIVYMNNLPQEAKSMLIERLTKLKDSENGFLNALIQSNESIKFLRELERGILEYESTMYDDNEGLKQMQESALGDDDLSIRDEDDFESDLEN